MPSVTEYRKIILVTDPLNPDAEVIKAAEGYGEIIFKLPCDDGILLLIHHSGDEFYVKANLEETE